MLAKAARGDDLRVGVAKRQAFLKSELAWCTPVWRPRGLSKWVISRVISTLNGVTLIITLLITDLLSPLGLQVVLNPKRSSQDQHAGNLNLRALNSCFLQNSQIQIIK